MRHNARTQRLGREKDQRIALIRGLVNSLVEHGRIKTTVAKAKELRRHAEKAVTVAKRQTLNARRVLLSKYPNEKVIQIIFNDLAPRFKDRAGGYTRIIKVGNRPGDNSAMAFIEWVDYEIKKLTGDDTKQAKKVTDKTVKPANKKTTKKATETKKEKAKEAKK